MKMTNPCECTFIETLLEFCLEKYGISFITEIKEGQVEETDILFNETIGNAVMNTYTAFIEKIQEYGIVVWNYIIHSTDPVEFQSVYNKMDEVAAEIFRSDNAIESAYIFLAVMVDVSILCGLCRNYNLLIQDFIRTIPYILNSRLPNKLIPDFDKFLVYANAHSQRPGN